MKVILRQNVKGLGERGKILNVKTGYARNFLVPKGFAFEYSDGNMKRFDEEKQKIKKQEIKDLGIAKEMEEKLKEVSVTIKQKAHDNDDLYGSVTSALIATELVKLDYPIDKSAVLLEEHIKKLGVYDVPVKLHTDIITQIKVWVVKDE